MAIDEAGLPAEVRFWSRVEKTDGCWLWAGYPTGGYGRIRVDGRRMAAHRFAYELLVGPIPDGLVIDHLCRNPLCVNPAHLEATTQQINVLRGEAPPAHQAKQDRCLRGHLLSGDNLIIRRRRRECRTCRRAAKTLWRQENRLRVNAQKRALYAAAKAA